MPEEIHKPEVGDVIVYHDPVGTPFNALVICTWSSLCLNLVTIEDDPARDDSYGRQIRRITSCNHKSVMPVHGNYWRWPREEPSPIVEPTAK